VARIADVLHGNTAKRHRSTIGGCGRQAAPASRMLNGFSVKVRRMTLVPMAIIADPAMEFCAMGQFSSAKQKTT
jgi:hypothetical protein